jgi:hypothetical protein
MMSDVQDLQNQGLIKHVCPEGIHVDWWSRNPSVQCPWCKLTAISIEAHRGIERIDMILAGR